MKPFVFYNSDPTAHDGLGYYVSYEASREIKYLGPFSSRKEADTAVEDIQYKEYQRCSINEQLRKDCKLFNK